MNGYAIFQWSNEFYAGPFDVEKEAEEDLWGRPDSCYVGPACLCEPDVRHASECPKCEDEDGL